MPAHAGKRLLLLCTTTGYQTRAFVESAEKLGVSIVFGTDRCHVLDDPWRDGAIPLRFEDAEASAAKLMEYAASHPIHGVGALGDRPPPTAGLLAEALPLPAPPRRTASVCRDNDLSPQ